MLELGGTGILLQGGLHPDLQIGYYENLLRSLKARFPQVHLHCFSAPEILCIAEVSEISVRETIERLMDAGLQSIPGGGAEILDDEVRARIARLKCTSDDWEEVHRVAHSLGLSTTATMMIGCGGFRKTPEDSPPLSPGFSPRRTPHSARKSRKPLRSII